MLCYENLGGVEIVGTQWFAFTLILVLFLIYFPPHLKYTEYQATAHPGHSKTCECDPCAAARAGPIRSTTSEWKLAITLAWVVFIHFSFSIFITVILLSGPQNPDGSPSDRVYAWATFLGLVSTSLAFIQYAPQLRHTYRSKLVGAISIPAMAIQSPGAVLMVYTIAIKPGTNWTSWMVYAAAGILQGSLLIMCLFWKARQKRLHIDDFGNPLPDPEDGRQNESDHSEVEHERPLRLGQGGTIELPASEQEVVREEVTEAIETTPLLRGDSARSEPQSGKKKTWGDILRWR
ncbi:hypothetical protein FRC03_010697 [Tulasnella sp. 419]|nr:hypothetical protein FRC03_010697 [Tulasnella sp. 419]